MDEYLSEKEQIEQIRQWWRENGWFLIGGAAVVVLGYFGYNQYRAHQDRVAEESASLYFELRQYLEDDDPAAVEPLLAQLAADYAGSPYLDQARLLVAQDNLVRDTERSIAELEAVVDQTNDEGMSRIARLRLARVLAYDEQFERALATLDMDDVGEFEARFSEVRGDIYAATGDEQAAIDAYTDALLAGGSANRQLLQLKLNALLQSRQQDFEAAAEAAVQTGTSPALDTAVELEILDESEAQAEPETSAEPEPETSAEPEVATEPESEG